MREADLARVRQDLDKKMVLLSGPRQVGKTWLAKALIAETLGALYLNYDDIDDRSLIKKKAWNPDASLIVFDEIHKMKGWKNFIKGVFDTRPSGQKLLVTGSARLETFRQSGDSLAGRYFRHRLFPFVPTNDSAFDRKRMLKHLECGGFPEPFLAEQDTDVARWRNLYFDGLIRQDILDFERVHDLHAVKLTLELLRSRVGSLISYRSIGEDVGVSPATVKRYIDIFEALYIVFRVSPYSKNIARALKKESKIYFYDTGLVRRDSIRGDGPRFENMVALALLHFVQTGEDVYGQNMSLHFLRTKDQRETDFCLANDNMLVHAFEAKVGGKEPDKGLRYFAKKYGLPATQIVRDLDKAHHLAALKLLPATEALPGLAQVIASAS